MNGPEQSSDGELATAALGQLDRMQAFFGRVEGKASFLFAVNLALLGSSAVAIPLKTPGSPAGFIGLAALALLGFSMVNLYAAFYPHLTNSRTSLLYFADIAQISATDFRHRIRAASSADRADDALCQVWRNAEILDKKFKRSRSAFLLTGGAIPFWLTLLALRASETGSIPGL